MLAASSQGEGDDGEQGGDEGGKLSDQETNQWPGDQAVNHTCHADACRDVGCKSSKKIQSGAQCAVALQCT